MPYALEWKKKVKKNDIFVAIVLFGMKRHSSLIPKKSAFQGHLVTLAKGHLPV